jgi:hypothetical protein
MVRNLDMKAPARYAVGVGLALAAFFLGRVTASIPLAPEVRS